MVERRRSTGRPARTRRWPRLGPRWSVEPQPRARRPTQRRLRWLGCCCGLPLGRGSPVGEEKEAEAVVPSAREERDRRQGTAAADRSSARRPWWCSARSEAEQGDNEREEENGESRGQGSGFQGERARCRGAHAGEREATRQRLAVLGRP